MRARRLRRAVVVGLAVALLGLIVGSTAALGAKPDRSPYNPGPLDLPAGFACPFDIRIETVSGELTETIFSNGSVHYTGSRHERVTNLDTGASVTVPTSGRARFTFPDDGVVRFQASGRTLFYFFPGDVGPFGPVGDNGALYYVQGGVDEILEGDDFVVTSFEWGGRATELCGLID